MNTLFELEEFSDITPVIRALPNVKISGDLILWAAVCCRANMYAGSFMSISGGESRMTIETFTGYRPLHCNETVANEEVPDCIRS